VTESLSVFNHDGAGCLSQTLSALARNTVAQSVECVVVDSGSSDGSWENVEGHWEKARALRFEENIGFCAGYNRGVEASTGRLAAFVNFDGEVERHEDRRQLVRYVRYYVVAGAGSSAS
jgi:GT2 family glycosyltransferase